MVNSVVGLWSSWIVAVTWQLAALALIALVCEKALRLRQPRVRHALWWFVLVAPLLLAPGRMVLARSAVAVQVPVSPAIARVVTPAAVPAPPPVPALETAMPAVTAAAASHPLRWSEIAAILWMAGCLFVGSRLLVGHWRMRRIALGSQAVTTGTVSAVLAVLCEEAGLKAIPLRTSDEVTAPVLYGLRPAVLLPEGWLDLLSADDIRALLAHEVAHAKRRDLLANLLQRLVEAPLFFHPGAWLASRRITLAREELADAWAVTHVTAPEAYARALASAADRAQRPLPGAVLGLTEGKSTLLRRVEAIMQRGSLKRMSRPLVVAIVAIGLISAAAFSAVQLRGEAKPTIMPPIPSGIHLKYRVTTQEFALPQDVIEMHIAGMKRSSAAAEENMLREMKARSMSASLIDSSIASNRAFHEKRIHEVRGRTVDGPIRTSAAEYWGTMHGFMYTNMRFALAYDGKKVVEGAAWYMVPELLKRPTAERSGMSIYGDASRIDDSSIPYLGIYQPGRWLFSDQTVPTERRALATGEEQVYAVPWPSRGKRWNVRCDGAGRVVSMSLCADSRRAQEPLLLEEFRFADYTTLHGAIYPREVTHSTFLWREGKDGRPSPVPDSRTVYSVTDAEAGPIPDSLFAVSTTRLHAQIEDSRYQVEGSQEKGVTYNYLDPSLTVDEASERAYKDALRQQE
jgi:beta-lactamase regulating signal transducer with metallopeptidase domain